MNSFQEKVFLGFENDIELYYCGKRLKNLSHTFGPYDRDTYLLYYIKEGSASLISNGEESEISASGFFVNFPHSQNLYQSKNNIPWSIKWIVIGGEAVEKYLSLIGISRKNPFLRLHDSREIENIFDEMYESFDRASASSQIYCVSLLYKLFSRLAESASKKPVTSEYILKASELIDGCFSEPDFNVARLAEMLGLHFNYFSVLFKKEMGISPVKAIADARMQSASKMLKFTDKPIKEICRECGFLDEFYFSRAFKKKFGSSPKAYRDSEEYLT